MRCGSVTELIKTKIGGSISGEASVGEDAAASATPAAPNTELASDASAVIPPAGERRSELARAMDNHVDKLDSLINKAERAEMALNNQNKQIKSFLK